VLVHERAWGETAASADVASWCLFALSTFLPVRSLSTVNLRYTSHEFISMETNEVLRWKRFALGRHMRTPVNGCPR